MAALQGHVAGDAALRHVAAAITRTKPVTGAPLVSVSIGIASVPPADSGPTVDELLQAADDALYEAKRAGGNQVGGAPERS